MLVGFPFKINGLHFTYASSLTESLAYTTYGCPTLSQGMLDGSTFIIYGLHFTYGRPALSVAYVS